MPEWKVCTVSEVAEVFDGPHATPTKTESGPWFLSISSLKQGKLDLAESAHLSDEDFQKWTRRVTPREGDILFSYETRLGEAAIMPEGIQACLGRRMGILRPRVSKTDPRFLLYAYLGPEFQQTIRERSIHGATVDRIPLVNLPAWPIRLPDLTEQQAIAGLLGALDDKIAVNDRMVATSHELMTALYLEALSSGVRPKKIGEIADVYDGPHATPAKTESGPWFLSISSLSQGRLRLEESAHLDEADFERWTRRVTPTAGDVLFSYETRLGEAALMPAGIRACLGRRMALLRPRGVGSRTLLQAFLGQQFQETIRQYAVHGATVDRIPLTEFPSWRIELPVDEGERLESALSGLGELAERREHENASLADLRDTLLPKLMSGQIRVREAEEAVGQV
jgi:type I restriction enzyme S subunit